MAALIDGHGRTHRSLRISVVDKCNLRCTYCMPEDMHFLPRKSLMTREEIVSIAKLFVQDHGIHKIRITGGEPLLRTDVVGIIEDLIDLGVEVGLTTNAMKLEHHLKGLVQGGLRSVNISLDSMHAERFKLLTRRDGLDRVQHNIQLALDAGLHVKVNMVVMQGINDDEIIPFVELTRNQNIHVRFIEFMPFAGNGWTNQQVFSYKQMLDAIVSKHSISKLHDRDNSTAKAWQVDGWEGTFAVISTITEPFCGSCDRLRLTAEGKMRNCLFAREETDLLGALRAGQDIRPLIGSNVFGKHKMLGGLPAFKLEHEVNDALSERPMVSIGG